MPEIGVDLPPTAIGKDYLGVKLVDSAPSGRGLQVSLFGLAAFTASGVEGVEVNLLGLTFGINPFDPALKLPLVGRLGPARAFARSEPLAATHAPAAPAGRGTPGPAIAPPPSPPIPQVSAP